MVINPETHNWPDYKTFNPTWASLSSSMISRLGDHSRREGSRAQEPEAADEYQEMVFSRHNQRVAGKHEHCNNVCKT